jgi:hypothetical protein
VKWGIAEHAVHWVIVFAAVVEKKKGPKQDMPLVMLCIHTWLICGTTTRCCLLRIDSVSLGSVLSLLLLVIDGANTGSKAAHGYRMFISLSLFLSCSLCCFLAELVQPDHRRLGVEGSEKEG